MDLYHIPFRRKAVVMAAVMAALFLVALDQMIVSTALGTIVGEFHSYGSIGLIVTSYLLFSTVTVPIAGKLSDMFGRRPIILAGVSIFTLGSLLSGSAQSIEMLVLWRAVQGLGGGIITANAFTIVGDLFAPRDRGRWQGIIGSVFAIASAVGPILGGFLTDSHMIFGMETNWRWTFWINVPVGIVAALLIALRCPAIRREDRPRIDYAGATTLATALAALVLAVDNTDTVFKGLIDQGWSLPVIQGALYGIAAVMIGMFIRVERKAKEPVLSLAYFKSRNFVVIMTILLLFGGAFLGTAMYIIQFNQQIFGADATQAGLMLLPMIAGITTTSIGGGWLVSKLGRYKWILGSGIVVSSLGMIAMMSLTASSPYWQEALCIAVVGLGFGVVMPITSLAVQNEFSQKDLGAVTASTQLFRGLGSTIGVAIMSGLLTAGITTQIAPLADHAYVQAVKRSPEAQQLLGDKQLDANTALNINQMQEVIAQRAHQGIQQAPVPANIPKAVATEKKEQALRQFDEQQREFHDTVVNAFAQSLHTVFLVSAGMLAVAFVLTLFIRELELKRHQEKRAE
ncbi:MFS transporter [Candidatus Saccharibacteria bacterium]|nr:MFS transporter [Candidatus Saccharibacteria bacterium]